MIQTGKAPARPPKTLGILLAVLGFFLVGVPVLLTADGVKYTCEYT